MKKIKCLKNITLFEILINTICAVLFFVGIFSKVFDLSSYILFGVGILHITSMILHWLAWNQLPTTHTHRIVFNIWVAGTFGLTFLLSFISLYAALLMAWVVIFFAAFWFIYYCMILFKEYEFLKRKNDLYEKRELIHF